jgi:hypothetical protein
MQKYFFCKKNILHIGTNELFSITTCQYERYLRDTIHELRICNPECIIIYCRQYCLDLVIFVVYMYI